jgi:hypothetical protein
MRAIFFVVFFVIAISVNAATKRELLFNSKLKYYKHPSSAKNIKEFFQKGIFYFRIRENSFYYDYDNKEKKDNWSLGIGGNIIYRSAYLNNISIAVGAYGVFNPVHMGRDEIGNIKSGKDVFSRFLVAKGKSFRMGTIAQSYLEYKKHDISLKVGRQIFESFLTKANDTKMIPNCFEGISLIKTFKYFGLLKIGWLRKQKLRDHTVFGDVITYGKDRNSNNILDTATEKYSNNDDSAVHKGLSWIKLVQKGKKTNHKLLVIEYQKKIEHLSLLLNHTQIKGLFFLDTVETYFEKNGFFGGIRLIKQFDDGGGKIATPNLKENAIGYKTNSLNSHLIGVKIGAKGDFWRIKIGYTKTADKADIIAPWRGFPTANYTRAMSQYNWYANTKTVMFRGDLDFKFFGINNLKGLMRYAIEDFDDKKPGVQADANILNIEFLKKFYKNLYFKIRTGFCNTRNNIVAINGVKKDNSSYNEYRFEINYLF